MKFILSAHKYIDKQALKLNHFAGIEVVIKKKTQSTRKDSRASGGLYHML